jgi:hypothetical protein
MPVHIDQMTSEIVPEPEMPVPPQSAPMTEWHETDHTRQLMARQQLDRMRIAAEGFDD